MVRVRDWSNLNPNPNPNPILFLTAACIETGVSPGEAIRYELGLGLLLGLGLGLA
jgi:hypothetical protein